MDNNIEFVELLPKVLIYKNLLPNSKELVEIIKDSEKNSDGKYFLQKWTPWSVFGTYTQDKHDDSYPREFGEMYDKEKYLSDSIKNAYNIAYSDYIKRFDITLPPDCVLTSSSYSKYNPNFDPMKNDLTMQYHTDYIMSEAEMPGPKFFLTCTTYLNDDYEGGDIEFYVDGEYYPYKPVSGDILVFPSGAPYYHGVRTIKGGEKFFIRAFMQYYFDGTPEWLWKQRYYGAHRWAKMEQERIEKENPKNMIYTDRKKTQ